MTDDSPAAPPFFELRSAGFSYGPGAEAARDVTLAVAAGEMVGVVGPNGAGKSTLLQLMAGLLRPGAGSARIEGIEAALMPPRERARRVAFVPQAGRVLFPYTVGEIVAMGRHPHIGPFAGPSALDAERIAWAMESADVARFAARPFSHLSGGEAQRVLIARALAQDAPALALDEPTSSLDLYHQASLWGLLERLNRERGLTVVAVTHDLNLAAEYCPRLVGLREGRLVMDGPPREIVREDRIFELYGVRAEVIAAAGGPLVRVRHAASGGGAS